jgi:hypothetical protein
MAMRADPMSESQGRLLPTILTTCSTDPGRFFVDGLQYAMISMPSGKVLFLIGHQGNLLMTLIIQRDIPRFIHQI